MSKPKIRRNVSEEYKVEARRRFEEQFEAVPECGCWIWLGGVNLKGYGSFWYNGRGRAAHRVSYELYKGTIPKDLHIMHSCDVTSCVNPTHLAVGTNTENHRDKMARGRNISPRGEASGRTDLKECEVLEIFKRAHKGELQKDIAADFSIKKAAVCAIKQGRNWGWLTGGKNGKS